MTRPSWLHRPSKDALHAAGRVLFVLVFVVYTTAGFWRVETVSDQRRADRIEQRQRDREATRVQRRKDIDNALAQRRQICNAVETLRSAVVVGQQQSAANPLPIPAGIDPALAGVITFVNARAETTSAAVLAEVDKARCPEALR